MFECIEAKFNKKTSGLVCTKTSHIAMKEGEERKQALVNVLELWIYQSIMSASSDKTETDTHTFSYIHSIFRRNMNYTKSLVNTNSFYTNFTNTDFQKVPIPHLTRTMKQKFLQ